MKKVIIINSVLVLFNIVFFILYPRTSLGEGTINFFNPLAALIIIAMTIYFVRKWRKEDKELDSGIKILKSIKEKAIKERNKSVKSQPKADQPQAEIKKEKDK